MKPSLNLGCGDDKRGTVRIDRNHDRAGVNLLADAHFIPLRDKSIGNTFCKSMLEHTKSPVKVVLEIKRITTNKIVFITPNVINIMRIIRGIKNPLHQVSPNTQHLQGWDSKIMKHLAILTGLKLEKITWFFEKPHRWGFMCNALFASHMIAVLKDEAPICEICGTLKKRLWCEPDFSYCPKCDIDDPECKPRWPSVA